MIVIVIKYDSIGNQALKQSLVEVAVISMPAFDAAKTASRLFPLLHVNRLTDIYLLKHGHRHIACHFQILLA
jgi:hypothetical protein